MEDLETGSWWQQVSGKAIQGPLKGKSLKLLPYDEISFGIWRKEHPRGRILRPDPELLQKGEYASKDWEARIGKLLVVSPVADGDPLSGRDLILGIERNGSSRAYPFSVIRERSLILDSIANTPLMIVVAEDQASIRVFSTVVEGEKVEFYMKTGSSPPVLVDAATGSEWSFEGQALSGKMTGTSLERIHALKDYWFDWKNYHPDTSVYRSGM